MKKPKDKSGKISTLIAAGVYSLLAVYWLVYIVRYIGRWEFTTAPERVSLCLLGAVLVILLLASAVLCVVRYVRGEDDGSLWHWIKTRRKTADTERPKEQE